MLRCVEHENSYIASGPDTLIVFLDEHLKKDDLA